MWMGGRLRRHEGSVKMKAVLSEDKIILQRGAGAGAGEQLNLSFDFNEHPDSTVSFRESTPRFGKIIP